MLPLLRRAFSGFQPAERRAMGEKVKHLGAGVARSTRAAAVDTALDEERARRVLPILAHILGVSLDEPR
jgi:hypothetical protein